MFGGTDRISDDEDSISPLLSAYLVLRLYTDLGSTLAVGVYTE